ncbi:hypothetical protein Krac_0389 [Ktedonobacter racemifer DSM 44963]|uniref:Uncharacterized protein n=1 Tax=Ktedonobacter racemifer DSM 44963 TaxID=485913 RepID=D6U7K8_KTERA|nr:hypothetical protein Krac_0389 [Ktedonobacter racemifer DSM 44963]
MRLLACSQEVQNLAFPALDFLTPEKGCSSFLFPLFFPFIPSPPHSLLQISPQRLCKKRGPSSSSLSLRAFFAHFLRCSYQPTPEVPSPNPRHAFHRPSPGLFFTHSPPPASRTHHQVCSYFALFLIRFSAGCVREDSPLLTYYAFFPSFKI